MQPPIQAHTVRGPVRHVLRLPHPNGSVAPAPAPAPASASAASSSSAASQQLLPPRPRKSCWTCGATGVPLKKCSVCAIAAYCGADCQKAVWKAHKGQCAGLKAGACSSGCSSAAGEKK